MRIQLIIGRRGLPSISSRMARKGHWRLWSRRPMGSSSSLRLRRRSLRGGSGGSREGSPDSDQTHRNRNISTPLLQNRQKIKHLLSGAYGCQGKSIQEYFLSQSLKLFGRLTIILEQKLSISVQSQNSLNLLPCFLTLRSIILRSDLNYFQMSYLDNYSQELGGFNFEYTQRNKLLQENKAIEKPATWKTGTTICGLKFKDGVVIAADTRATAGTIVVEKNCEKIHYVAPNIWACGAGTAADTQFVNLFMSSNLELQRLNSGRETRVAAFVAFVTRLLYKYEGELGAHLIAGGYDALGPHIAMISGYGNYSYLPFAAMGSGSLNATTVLESKYHDELTREEAIQIATEAITAGIYHDLGSGSNVDFHVFTKGKVERFRNAILNKDLAPMNL